ncbi:MAG: SDR family oxidoreductase [Actinomycetota bacterium]|nr:SDR family oxidoreductase [Actinomycetota bacterium]
MALRQERAWGAYATPPLRERVAVVTGASKGLGAAITDVLACDGAHLVLAGRDRDALEEHADRLDGEYPERESVCVRCDVRDEHEVRALMTAAVERFGGIDIVVNTAGVIGPIETPAQEVALEDFRFVLDVNLVGTFLVCKAAIPHLVERGAGRIVNIAGTSGLRGYRNRVAYSSSKWAVRGLTRTLALELGPHDVTVNTVCPNVTHGGRMTKIVEEKARKLGKTADEVYSDFAAQTALGRFVEPWDVAQAVRFLVSDAARNITGHDVPVDAGWDV